MVVANQDLDLTVADRTLCKAALEALPLIHLEPINATEESALVENNPKYSPRLRYAPPDVPLLSDWIEKLDALELVPQGIGLFFCQARDYLRRRLELRLHLGQDDHWHTPIYPLPPQQIVQLARRMLAASRPPNRNVPRSFHVEQLARLIRSRLKQYQLDDWQVVIRSNISSINTDSANRIISLRVDTHYTMEEMKGLVVHEVDTHVLRAANGYSQPYHIFAVGAVPSYLMTEEGLAVVNEERMGYINYERNLLFAARVLASLRASTGSFSDVYIEQRDYGFPHEQAFTIAKRVKRGLADTSLPGGYVKDQVYLWGRILVEKFVLSGGDLSRLYVGKVALEHVPLIPELGLRPARYIPYPYS